MYHVTVTKIQDKGTIKEGESLSHPIFEGYTIRGLVQALPEVGQRWIVTRYERNGVQTPGIFTTTEVTDVYHNENTRVVLAETNNSAYRIEYTLDTDAPIPLSSPL